MDTAGQGTTGTADTADSADTAAAVAELAVSEVTSFGRVPLEGIAEQPVTLSNLGTAPLTIGLATVQGDAAFALSGGYPMVLAAGEARTQTLTFRPEVYGEHSGTLRIQSDDPSTADWTAPLTGWGAGGTLQLSPEVVEFSDVEQGCTANQTLSLVNTGAEELQVEQLTVDSSTGDVGLSYTEPSALPWVLRPGDELVFYTSYTPSDEGSDRVALTFTSTDLDHPQHTATIEGTSPAIETVVDSFTASVEDQIDILFALDTTSSMQYEIDDLQGVITELTSTLDALGVDWRIAAVNTDDACISGAVGYLDASTAAADQEGVFSAFTDFSDAGENAEAAFAMMEAGLAETATGGCNEGFVRADAHLGLVGMSDQPEGSPSPFSTYVTAFQALKARADMVRIHGIGGDYPGGCTRENAAGTSTAEAYDGMYQATMATSGSFSSVCTSDWEALAQFLGAELARGLILTPSDTYSLSVAPEAATIVVRTDGAVTSSGWSYDATAQAVVFDAEALPPARSAIDIEYRPELVCPD